MPAVFMRYWGFEAEGGLTLKIFASCHQSVSSCVGSISIVRGKWRICGGVELQLQAAACADPEAEAASQSSLTLACTPSFLPCTGFTLQPCTRPALHQDYPPAPIQALEYPQCPAPGQLCSESVLCTIRHHVFLALDLPHTRSVLHPAYIYMATKHCLSDFLACSLSPNLTFSDSLGLAPPQQNQPGTVASLLTMYCDYQEQSSVTPQTQGKVQPDKVTCTITRNWRKNAAVIGSSTTPQAMFTNTRQKLNCEDKLGKGF